MTKDEFRATATILGWRPAFWVTFPLLYNDRKGEIVVVRPDRLTWHKIQILQISASAECSWQRWFAEQLLAGYSLESIQKFL